jgi:hypothetical protein
LNEIAICEDAVRWVEEIQFNFSFSRWIRWFQRRENEENIS